MEIHILNFLDLIFKNQKYTKKLNIVIHSLALQKYDVATES